MFCDIKALQRDTKCEGEQAFKKVSWSPGKTYVKKRGVRTITTFSKDPRKGVCHPVDIFQKETSVFLPDFQTRIFFFFFKLSLQPCCDTERGLAAQPEAPTKQILIL